jgi:LCP family protein required for cell wall assembly
VKKYLFTNNLSLLIPIVLEVITASTVTTYLYFQPNQTQLIDTDNFEAKVAQARELTTEELKDLETLNILLLGYGGAGHQGGFLTDVIQVLQINFKNQQTQLISIPRDLWVKLPTGKQAKINQAFTLGQDPNQLITSGGQIAKQMSAVVTGLPIDYFIAVDFVDFQRLIGQDLGGIEVEVNQTLDDPWYPIKGEELNPCGMSPEEVATVTAQYSGFELERQFECRYEQLHYEPGLVKMEGGDALKFVRSRHGSAAGDFSRSQRQQAVLTGIKKKLLNLEAFDQIPEFFTTVSQNISTDLDLEIIKYLAPALKSAGKFDHQNLILSTDNVLVTGKTSDGQFVLQPKAGNHNWQQIHQLIGN